MDYQYYILDEYDKKLLYELDKNSGTSLSQLAKAVNRSKQFTLFRLRRLEDESVVTSYNAIVDMAKLGYFTFRIYLKLQQMTRSSLNDLMEYLKAQEHIWTIAVCHGKWDLAFFIGTRTIEAVHQVWDGFLQRYKKNVESYNFSLYSPIYNFNRKFFLAQTKDTVTRTYGESGNESVDDTDLRIITTYASDVRQSFLELSRKLKLSPETVKSRIKHLQKRRIICGYKIGMDINRLGYVSYRIDLKLTSTSRNKELLEYCRQHRAIYQINKTVGYADFEIELVVKDLNELLDIIDDIKTRFQDVVNNASYFSYSTYFLLNYIPD